MNRQPTPQERTDQVRSLLEAHWDDDRGWCVPNPGTYPHLWLWDSCFHAIIWANLGDSRALRELDAVLEGQLADGMVPHMRYGGGPADTWLGPLASSSSLTQPPMFGHAIKVLREQGLKPSTETIARARRGLDWLWEHRRTDDGLIYIVHPWEGGNDHSPRWDDWGAPGRTKADYSRPARTAWNKDRMQDISFADDGAAQWSSVFVTCPASFNAYVAFNFAELGAALDDGELTDRAQLLSTAMDTYLWDEDEQLWSDLALVGGGASARIPTSDGVMGALVTTDRTKAEAALNQLEDPARFGSDYGPTNVARTHPSYDPGTYWRGTAWPPLNYLFWLAELRWGRTEAAGRLSDRTVRAAVESGWAEYWNPETGEGLGAIPQSWTGLVVAMLEKGPR
ncbi:trehalase family glycosidase [Arthrobacter sp. H5]|uniref:MGH1-like glycoside hydrolase domain-containing protein n=1 Tax=Arthrobacter sp. H5 TaxID=1267973 RepID=UPI0004BA48ED|nr:trehalase family glycosidase [Arthrobacter sp. H5]